MQIRIITKGKKGMCYLYKKLNPISKLDEIKTRAGCKKYNQFICSEHYTNHLFGYFDLKEK